VTSAAELLRSARERAQLTQRDLAKRAGVAQSVISVYEAGRRQPSVQTLANLIEATGQRLRLVVEPQPQPAGSLLSIVTARAADIKALAAEHQVAVLGVFGSVARGEDSEASDIDLLIELGPDPGLFALGRLRAGLVDLLGVSVDLVPASDLKPEVRQNVLADLIRL
jgi:predicted nucleotidyltransferase/DNA-binding XRE family transcriptional regulator